MISRADPTTREPIGGLFDVHSPNGDVHYVRVQLIGAILAAERPNESSVLLVGGDTTLLANESPRALALRVAQCERGF